MPDARFPSLGLGLIPGAIQVLGSPSTEIFLVRDRPSYDFWGKATHRGVWQGLLAAIRPHHRFFKCSLDAVYA